MSTSARPFPRILLIDDNPAIHQDYRKVLCPQSQSSTEFNQLEAIVLGEQTATAALQNTTFEIESAMQGQDGLRLAEKALAEGRPYSVAFVDMRMDPGWNGIETIKHLWKVQPALQVVLCSAYSDYSWKEIVAALGASDSLVILRKPFDNVEVLQLALALSRKWQVMQELRSHVRDLDGQVANRDRDLAVINNDLRRQITDRAIAEERFRSAFEFSPVPMCIVNIKSMKWVDANNAFTTLSGCTRADLTQQRTDVTDFWNHQPDSLRKLLATTGEVNGIECQFSSRQGREHTVQFTRRFMHLHDQPHVLLLINDVTAQRNNEEKARQGMKMEAIGRLAAGVAHDFNNILTVIKGQASLMLGDESLPAHAQRAIEQMADAARRATGLVKQLLAFGRQQIINPRPIDISAHLEGETKMLTRLIGERIVLRCESQPNLPAAMVDPGSLDQILLNLVVNSRDAMPNGGSITIEACTARIDENHCSTHGEAQSGDFIRIKVADTGTGIPKEIQSRIFEPFFSTKESSRGTGLGLATVHGLVKQQSGWLELESSPGNGTTFFIYLPKATVAAEAQRPITEALRPTDWKIGGGRAALIVEDEETIRSVLRQLLTRFGFDVLEAANGTQALDIWRQKQQDIQLVMTDVVMPGSIDGLELGQRITADRPQVKMIYCTGYSAETVGGSSPMLEGVNFLAKPYDAQSLMHILNRLFPKKGSKPPTGRLKRNGTTGPLKKAEPAAAGA